MQNWEIVKSEEDGLELEQMRYDQPVWVARTVKGVFDFDNFKYRIKPEIDWAKVPKGTIVECSSNADFKTIYFRRFSHIKEDRLYAFNDGDTVEHPVHLAVRWSYMRLLKEPEEAKGLHWVKNTGVEPEYKVILAKLKGSGYHIKCKSSLNFDLNISFAVEKYIILE